MKKSAEGIIISKKTIKEFYGKTFRTSVNEIEHEICKFTKGYVRIRWYNDTHSTVYSESDALDYISNGEWILKT